MNRQFVMAFNGNRDKYELPLALEEAGLLEALVTDFYTDADDPLYRFLPKSMLGRQRVGLARARVRRSWGSLLVQAVGRVVQIESKRLYPHTDRMIARHAGRVARKEQAPLFCYGGYLPLGVADIPGPHIVFQYHPHAVYIRELFERDAINFPEWAHLYNRQHEMTASLDLAQLTDWSRADHVFCASSVTKRSLERVGGYPQQMTVIPYGSDKQTVPRARAFGTCEFLFVGQGIPRKGLHHLLSAWEQAALSKARLTLICYVIDDQLAQRAMQLGVQVLGRQSREALDRAYSESDVFVMPSIVEGFGLVYLEALAHGCFVIGTTETGLPDLELPDDVAAVIEPGDITQLTATLIQAADRKTQGGYDPERIAAEAANWSWKRFRQSIAAAAQVQLSAAEAAR